MVWEPRKGTLAQPESEDKEGSGGRSLWMDQVKHGVSWADDGRLSAMKTMVCMWVLQAA